MKVILQKDIPNLGDSGEIKDVADGYARNFLIPRKLVIPATSGSSRSLAHQKRLINLKTEKRRKEMAKVSEQIKSIAELEIPVRLGAKNRIFGSVTTAMIVKAIEEKSNGAIILDRRKVEPADPIKTIGEHKLRIHLAQDIRVPIVVKVIAHPESVVEEKPAAPAEEAAVAPSGDATPAPAKKSRSKKEAAESAEG